MPELYIGVFCMTKRHKKMLGRILAAAVLFGLACFLQLGPAGKLAAFLICYAVIGWGIGRKAAPNIVHGQEFD